MPRRKLYIDEDVSGEIVAALRSEHDVLYLAHNEHKGKTDAWHLQRASVEQRILLTHNASDFRFLHRVWSTMRTIQAVTSRHAGILTTAGMIPPGDLIPALLRKLSGSEEFGGRLLLWNQSTDRWLEDAWRPED